MNPPHEIETLIIRAALTHIPPPPVDLVDVASRLGVRDIRATRFRDGFTDFRSSPPVIFLNRNESSCRMRFIFAHELAHVILRTSAVWAALEELGQTKLLEHEEELADRIARTMLVPATWVAALSAARYTLDGLQRVAGAAQVSLATLVRRMTTAGIDVGLLHWLRGDRDWYVVDRPGTPPCLHGDLRLSDESRLAFDLLSNREVRTQIRAYIGGRRLDSTGTASRTGREVFYLIDRVWYPSAFVRYTETVPQVGFIHRISQLSSIDPRV
jgi:hypothetical protein